MSNVPEPNPYANTPPSHGPINEPAPCGQATVSLVLGLLSFCLLFITGIPAVILGFVALSKINKSAGQLKGTGFAITGLVTGGLGTLLIVPVVLLALMVMPAVQAVQATARQMQSKAAMKSIGIAMMSYEATKETFPAAGSASADPKTGAALSWRVHLLPYLDEQTLYDQFHLDEPWDSPHNITLLPMMPPIYASLSFEGDPTKTIYLVVVQSGPEKPGANTLFGNGTQPVKEAQIIDGRSATIMFVEVDPSQAVPWTKPADLELDPNNPRRGLGTFRTDGFLATMGDSSVQLISNDTDQAELLNMLLRDDGN